MAEETLALAAGILVTGSAASLPFSEGGVRALEAARARRARRGEACVLPAHLLHAALGALPADLRAEVEDAGCDLAALEARFGPPGRAVDGAPDRRAVPGLRGAGPARPLDGAARLARQERLATPSDRPTWRSPACSDRARARSAPAA